MGAKPASVKEYLDGLPEDRRAAILRVRAAVNEGLPEGYEEGIQYGMIGWFVPHRLFPGGYHCDPRQPVPFASLASQKNHLSLYLMCVYGDEKHRAWFEREWAKSGKRLDMGKSCVRFKRAEDLPLELISEAVRRVPVDSFLAHYQGVLAGMGRKRPAAKKVAKKTTAKKVAMKPTAKRAAKKSAAKKASKKRAVGQVAKRVGKKTSAAR